jgi:acetolactate synthase-1/2/3 large subunit
LGKSNINYIINLHEQGAGIAAEAYAQYTNEPSVAIVTTGPGGTNIVTAIAGAWLESTPMVVIAGQVNTYDRACNKKVRQLGFQEIDLVSIVRPITKMAVTLVDPQKIKSVLDDAFNIANSGRKGPVLIEIPLDIQSSQVDDSYMRCGLDCTVSGVNPNLYVESIIDALNKSKRPIILAGNGIRLSNGLSKFYEFIEKTQIPVLTTWKAADFLEETHHLFVGRPGTIASRGANFNQQNADFIMCIGARLDHGQIAYQDKYFAPNAVKVVVDISITELEKFDNMNIDFEVPCDAYEFLAEMNLKSNTIKIDTHDWLKRCKNTYEKYPVILPEHSKSSEKVNMYAFIDALSDALPNDALIVPGSSGICSEVTFQSIKLKTGQRILNTQGLGAMGFGIPAAIGACIASGKKPTICIDGDGGFMMNIQELEIVKRLELPIIFFVLNNNGYASIRTTQNTHFDGNLVGCDTSCGLTLPNIMDLAKGFGLRWNLLRNNSSLYTLQTILDLPKPRIIEVMIDPNHVSLPRTSVKKNEEGNFVALPMEDMKPFLSREEFGENVNN